MQPNTSHADEHIGGVQYHGRNETGRGHTAPA
jgi:hypothetical protein